MKYLVIVEKSDHINRKGDFRGDPHQLLGISSE